MFCIKCGQEFPEEANFCMKCGFNIKNFKQEHCKPEKPKKLEEVKNDEILKSPVENTKHETHSRPDEYIKKWDRNRISLMILLAIILTITGTFTIVQTMNKKPSPSNPYERLQRAQQNHDLPIIMLFFFVSSSVILILIFGKKKIIIQKNNLDKQKKSENSNWLNTGIDLLNSGRFEEAIQAFDKDIKENNSFHTWHYKGVVLKKLYRFEEADESFETAKSLNKNYNPLEFINYEEALERFEREIKINELNKEAWQAKGEVLLKLGRNEEANKAFAYIMLYINRL